MVKLTLLTKQTGVVGDLGEDPDSILTTAAIGGNLGVERHLLPTWMQI